MNGRPSKEVLDLCDLLWGDVFAGFGGTSTGFEEAFGRPPDFAINHWGLAIKVHKTNHPDTEHHTESVWKLDPNRVTKGRQVGGLWFSPDCTHFSSARGGKPRRQAIRALANIIPGWLERTKAPIFFVENVREFLTWGPLDRHGDVIEERKGEHFQRWLRRIERLGYTVEWRVLDCSDYGAPTSRKRLFIIGRCDGEPITWPEPTHGEHPLLPKHSAAECIDFSIPAGSIFPCTCDEPTRNIAMSTHCVVCGGRVKPLAEKTMWRIAQGLRRFLFEDPNPYVISIDQKSTGRTDRSVKSPFSTITTVNRHAVVVPHLVKANHGGKGRREARVESIRAPFSTITAGRRGHSIVVPILQQSGYGERKGQRARVLDIRKPIGTCVDGQKHALVTAFLTKYFGAEREGGFNGGSSLKRPIGAVTSRDLVKLRGQCHGADLRGPMPTLTSKGTHLAEVRAFLTAYYGEDGSPGCGQDLREPMRTLTSKARLGLVTVHGVDYQLTDICFRMLTAPELLRGQMGELAEGYDLSDAETQEDQIAGIGNMVPPKMAAALLAANVPSLRRRRAA